MDNSKYLNLESRTILDRVGETFQRGAEAEPIVPYLPEETDSEKPLASTQLEQLGFEKLWETQTRVGYRVPDHYTLVQKDLMVKLARGPNAAYGTEQNRVEAKTWEMINSLDNRISQSFVPVRTQADDFTWIIMPLVSELRPVLADGVIETQFRRLHRLLERHHISTPVTDETTALFRGKVRLLHFDGIQIHHLQETIESEE